MVTSYESLYKVPKRQFDLLVVDEAHYIKEPTAGRTREILGKTGRIHQAKRTWLLTGTPTPNHAGELWPALFTSNQVGDSYERFVEKYCTTRETGFGKKITGTNKERIPELRRILGGIMLKRSAKEVNLQLPEIFYSDILVPKGPVHLFFSRKFFKYSISKTGPADLKAVLEKEYGIVANITNGVFSDATFEAIKAQASSISSLREYVALQKIQPIIDLVSEELKAGAYRKIVIFCHHRCSVLGIQMGLRQFGAVTMYGGTPEKKKEKHLKKFQTSNMCRILIATIGSCGTSVNLTQCNQVLFAEQTFVPADMEQAAKRCHRIGQKEPVRVRFVAVDDGVDQHVARILRRKTAELSELYGDAANYEVEGLDLTGIRKPSEINNLV